MESESEMFRPVRFKALMLAGLVIVAAAAVAVRYKSPLASTAVAADPTNLDRGSVDGETQRAIELSQIATHEGEGEDFVAYTVHHGMVGEWQKEVVLPFGQHVVGCQIRMEGPIRKGDDTAANSVRMLGDYLFTPDLGTLAPISWVEAHPGFWGDWEPEVTIPEGYRITGFSVRDETYVRGIDNTGMNGLVLICSKGAKTERVVVSNGYWGNWQPDVLVPGGWYVAGFQLRILPRQRGGDDCGLCGIRALLRKMPE